MEQTVFDTISTRNPKEAIALLRKNGYPIPKGEKELNGYLKDYLRRNDNQNGYRTLAMIHPDKELILATLTVKNFDAQESLNADASQNCDASYKNCSGCVAMAALATDGQTTATKTNANEAKVMSAATINTIIVSAAVVLGLAIIASTLSK